MSKRYSGLLVVTSREEDGIHTLGYMAMRYRRKKKYNEESRLKYHYK
jgi:hypothetical protein